MSADLAHTELPATHRTGGSVFRRIAARFIIPAGAASGGLRVACDIEGNGFLDTVATLHCIAVANLDTDQVDAYGPEQIAAGLEHLARADYLTGHNILDYDLRALHKLRGWTPKAGCRVIDTLPASRLILPHIAELDDQAAAMGDPKLGKLRGRYSIEAWGLRLGMPKVGADLEDFSTFTPEMLERCVGDTAITKRVWQFLQPDGYSQSALALEHRVSPICGEITAAGMFFDTDAAARLKQQWEERRGELAAQLQQQFPGTNLNSHKQIAALLEARGWTPEKRTKKTKQPVIDGEVLETIATTYPEFTGLSEHAILGRRLGQLVNGKKAWTKSVGADGRIHGAIVHIGTPHSRAKHLDPNLAQVPNPKRGKPFATECRSLFKARDGWVLVACDQAALQDRGFAHYLAEFDGGAYAKILASDIDRHWKSSTMLGLVPAGTERNKNNKTHALVREGAKGFYYGFLFGAQDERAGRIIYDIARAVRQFDPTSELLQKLFDSTDRPKQAALKRVGKKARDAFMDGTPGLRRLRDNLEAQARRGWLPGLDGRRVPVRALYTALNYAVTSAEAIICKRWLVHTYDELRAKFRYGWDGDVVVCLWAHDEIVACCRPEIAKEVGEILVRHAKEPAEFYGFKVALGAECKVSRNWGSESIENAPAPLNAPSIAPKPAPEIADALLASDSAAGGNAHDCADAGSDYDKISVNPDETGNVAHGIDAHDRSNKSNGDAKRSWCRPVSFVVFPRKAMTPSEAAISLAAQGVFVFPAPPNTKKSHKSEKFSGKKWGMTNDPREVKRDFKRWPDANVGIPTGKENGFFVVEADTKKGHDVDGIANLRQLEQQHGELPKTRMAMSPSGSTHCYFRNLYDDPEIRNSSSALAPGVDVRGSGGMVIAPPSLRGDGQYRWLNDLEIAEPPRWLLDLIFANQARHEQIKVESEPEYVAGDGFDGFGIAEEPIEKINAALAVLDPSKLGHDGNLKVACALFSALGDAGGFDLLTNWLKRCAGYYDAAIATEQWKSIAAKNGYGYRIGSLYYLADAKDGEWRARWSDGNQSHEGGAPKTDGSAGAQTNGDQSQPGKQAQGNEKVNAQARDVEPVDLWGKLDPPPLPTGLLPGVIERFAVEESRLMGADSGGLALGALAVCAAAISDRTQLQVKQQSRNWAEPARIWVGLIGNPSTKKTPIIVRVTKPLKALDAEMWRTYLAAKECYDELSSEQQRSAERPRQKRLRIEDTTIEGAQEVLKDSPDGVLCIQPELSGHRGAAKDRGFWLQSYDGGPYAINRIKRGAGLIENLSISLLGGIQPDPMRKIAADTVDDGLLQRLIPIVLRSGRSGKDEPITQDAGWQYDELIERLHLDAPPADALRFDAGAQATRGQLEQKHLDLMAFELISKKLASHIGKYDGLFARLCVLWHCIEGNEKPAIAENTAQRVANFMHRFLLPHAFAFYGGMLGFSDDHERLTAVAGHILAHKLERVTNRDVQRGDRTMRGLTRKEIEGVFEQLDALGWVTRTPGPWPAAPPHWIVNPVVHRRFVARAEREATERARLHDLIKEMVKQD